MAEDIETEVSLMPDSDPKAFLKAYLSTNSYLSPFSSASIIQEYPHTTDSLDHYPSIGHGQCAEIFHQTSIPSPIALKKAHPPPCKHAELRNDSLHHRAVVTAFLQHSRLCHVPAIHTLIGPDNDDWHQSYGRLIPVSKLDIARGSRERTPILAMERIPPVPERVRDALVEQFCPSNLGQRAREDGANRDCLLRIYMGAKSYSAGSEFSLRNFPLSLDKMEELRLDVRQYAEAVAEGLAVLHWGARVNGRDVEFVLGLSRGDEVGAKREGGNGVKEEKGEKRRCVWVWVLDFNQCESIEMNERGAEMAVWAFWDNDPYFPRPEMGEGKSGGLWEVFRRCYEEVSGRILEGEEEVVKALPGLFLERVRETGKRRGVGYY